jgi:hypothetical protein
VASARTGEPQQGSSQEPSQSETPAQTPAPQSTATQTEPARATTATRTRDAKDGPGVGAKVKAGTDAVRNRIASVVWLVAVICALFLAVGALLIALKANQDNEIVKFVLNGAEKLDGPFSRDNGIFTFKGHDAATKAALVNWGIAAVCYLIIGKILDRIIRP